MTNEAKRNEDTVEPLVRLASAVRELLAVIDAHDMDTLDCDRSGQAVRTYELMKEVIDEAQKEGWKA